MIEKGKKLNPLTKNFYEQSFFENLFKHHPNPVFLLDTHGRVMCINYAFQKLLGITQMDEVCFSTLVEDPSISMAYFQKAISGTPQIYNITAKHINGNTLILSVSYTPIVEDGVVVGIYGVAKDITEKMMTEKKLKEKEQQYYSLFHYNSNAIFVLSEEGNFTHVNPATESITGFTESELLTMSFLEVIKEKNNFSLGRYIKRSKRGFTQNLEIEMLHKSGNTLYLNITLVPNVLDGKLHGSIGIAQDITEKRKAEQQIIKMAEEDALTGLPNRRLLVKILESTIASKKKAAILFIDIDRFKIINDTLGHLFGDEALISITRRISSCIRDQDTLARMGGDEFVLLMPEVSNTEEVQQVAEKILEAIRVPYDINGYEFTLTSSIGISIFPDNGKDSQALICSADAAMYRAKASGTDAYAVYTSEMSRSYVEWFRVENDLRKALEREEFELYFQPQYYTSSEEICGIEVLVRWRHPEEGVISPAEFLEIAEETGLIGPIGEWVLRESCKQMKQWLDEGYPRVPLSVNLSLKQFMQKNIVQLVTSILEETKLPPKYLNLEVTESTTIDLDRTLNILNQLKSLGIKISLDDFGTGYSSLQYLSVLPLDELKVDQSFVKNINDDRNKAIIAMIINLGHLLKLTVIAEGVETQVQLQYLKEQGCDKIQGYICSKPLTAIEYTNLFSK